MLLLSRCELDRLLESFTLLYDRNGKRYLKPAFKSYFRIHLNITEYICAVLCLNLLCWLKLIARGKKNKINVNVMFKEPVLSLWTSKDSSVDFYYFLWKIYQILYIATQLIVVFMGIIGQVYTGAASAFNKATHYHYMWSHDIQQGKWLKCFKGEKLICSFVLCNHSWVAKVLQLTHFGLCFLIFYSLFLYYFIHLFLHFIICCPLKPPVSSSNSILHKIFKST